MYCAAGVIPASQWHSGPHAAHLAGIQDDGLGVEIPAGAGMALKGWIPAFAGMTSVKKGPSAPFLRLSLSAEFLDGGDLRRGGC